MVKNLRGSIRYMYDDSIISYIQLLVAARKVETEVIDSKVTIINKAGLLSSNHSEEIKALTNKLMLLWPWCMVAMGKKSSPITKGKPQQGGHHPNSGTQNPKSAKT